MRLFKIMILVCFLLVPASALWAADDQENKEKMSSNMGTATAGAMDNEEMAKDTMSEPMPPKEVAHQDHMEKVSAPEPSAMAEGMMDKDKADDMNEREEAENTAKMEHKGMDMDMMKHHGPKDMVMMNMMMHKMKRMHGPNVIATYDGGIVVVSGNKITKYDDELNYVNAVELKNK